MRRAGLRTRLARLERKCADRSLPNVILGIYDLNHGSIVGFTVGNGAKTDLTDGESVADMANRAFRTGAAIIAAVYPPEICPQRAGESKNAPSPHPIPTQPPVGTPWPSLARAPKVSQAQLQAWGFIPPDPA